VVQPDPPAPAPAPLKSAMTVDDPASPMPSGAAPPDATKYTVDQRIAYLERKLGYRIEDEEEGGQYA